MRKKIKRWMIDVAVCAVLLSGCGAKKSDEKASKQNTSVEETQHPTEATQKPSAKETHKPAEATQEPMVWPVPYPVGEEGELPYQTLMKKYKNRVSKASDWKSKDGSYHYPITHKDEEWKKMDVWEQWAACQIPEEILKKLDTKELLKLVLEFPDLDEIMFSDSYSEWLTEFCAPHFNGMHELLNRPDFYETVLAYYEKLKIPLHCKSHLEEILPENPTSEDYLSISESEQEKVDEDVRFANTIDFCMTVVGGLTDGVEKDVLKKAKKVFAKKFLEKEASEYDDGGLTMSRERIQNADWMDQKVVGGLKSSDQDKDGKKNSKKSKAASGKKQSKRTP